MHACLVRTRRAGLTERSEWFGGFGQILQDTPAVETSAPSGSVVLWHTKTLHMRGHNTKKPDPSQDTIRQATIYAFVKTPQSLPDDRLMTREGGDIWQVSWRLPARPACAACVPSSFTMLARYPCTSDHQFSLTTTVQDGWSDEVRDIPTAGPVSAVAKL
eukprot:SAG22_NODE_183_length_16031_cov_36.647000_12_plen_160_part_00